MVFEGSEFTNGTRTYEVLTVSGSHLTIIGPMLCAFETTVERLAAYGHRLVPIGSALRSSNDENRKDAA